VLSWWWLPRLYWGGKCCWLLWSKGHLSCCCRRVQFLSTRRSLRSSTSWSLRPSNLLTTLTVYVVKCWHCRCLMWLYFTNILLYIIFSCLFKTTQNTVCLIKCRLVVCTGTGMAAHWRGPCRDGDNVCCFTVGMGAKMESTIHRDTAVCISKFAAALACPLYGANVLLKIVDPWHLSSCVVHLDFDTLSSGCFCTL